MPGNFQSCSLKLYCYFWFPDNSPDLFSRWLSSYKIIMSLNVLFTGDHFHSIRLLYVKLRVIIVFFLNYGVGRVWSLCHLEFSGKISGWSYAHLVSPIVGKDRKLCYKLTRKVRRIDSRTKCFQTFCAFVLRDVVDVVVNVIGVVNVVIIVNVVNVVAVVTTLSSSTLLLSSTSLSLSAWRQLAPKSCLNRLTARIL